jgi:excisionase family DNA binding protein
MVGVHMDSSRPYLTIRETAVLLALSTRTIHRYIAEGKLKAYRVAGEKVIRIKREDVDALPKPLGDEGEAWGTNGEQPRSAENAAKGARGPSRARLAGSRWHDGHTQAGGMS